MSRWVSDIVYNNLIGIVMGIDNDNIYTLVYAGGGHSDSDGTGYWYTLVLNVQCNNSTYCNVTDLLTWEIL